MAVTTAFVTGFPGFLGSALVERLLDRHDRIACLVQPEYRAQAERRAAEIVEEGDDNAVDWTERIDLYEGDITEGDLGLDVDDYADLRLDCDEVYHLAAVYDLAVSPEVGQAVNVDGTRHVVHFAEKSPNLRRFQYVSTCYVSGRYDGLFTESNFDVGQEFNNHYEETKYRAEAIVREARADGLPTTIYRPAIAVGDSETGETQKYDGPYFVLQWLLRQGDVAILPSVANLRKCEVNLVPRDFVVDAIDYLSGLDRSEDTVYHLSDPSPPTAAELVRIFAEVTDKRVVTVPLPFRVAKGSLERVPGLYDWMRIEPEAINYFRHPTRYTCANTRRDLAESGIECPSLSAYAETLVEFMESHPEVSPEAMT